MKVNPSSRGSSGQIPSHYDHAKVEVKWQKKWEETKIHVMDMDRAKKPFYNLMMFPYPSAEGLHVGNMYAFTGSDIYGRFQSMQGHDVFEPIGLDGFGIHSENYALKIGKHPMEQAKISEANFYRQLRSIGCMFDWSRTVETYDPGYYKWTQWLFVGMFKHGLAYRGKAQVNWCPFDKTVLADEQVIDEKCERCGNSVEKRSLEQWFFRITAYAEKLLENISSLKWSDKVLTAQKNWIGKKEGINISYDVVDEKKKKIGEITCFTTRPDTNFGATFMVLAPEHPFISQILKVIKNERRVETTGYVQKSKKMSQNDRIAQGRKKTGVNTGLYCVNPLTGRMMPLFVSDFVVMGVGTGAVVGVPGHDMRDFEFAREFHILIKRVVVGPDGDKSEIVKKEQVQEEEGTMINSDFLDGMEIHKAIEAMMDFLEKKGWGKRVTTYHLRDWLISRQRYWGPPIPMIYCETCAKNKKGERKEMPGWYTVPEKDLPVLLPNIPDYKPGDDGIAPLAKHKEFYNVPCPGCGSVARRETDVSDTFLDSSWYFFRYISTDDDTCPWRPERARKWMPVNMYTGGAEHSVLHLLYSRFITLAFHGWGLISHFEEPFPNFYAHGLVIKDGAKMSKSKGNVVNPDEYIKLYGTDALRLYLMFMGPFSEGGDFRDAAMEGMARWVGRVWRIAITSLESSTQRSESDNVQKALHRLVKKVGEDTEKRHYNTAIAAMMEFTNLVTEKGSGLKKLQGQTPLSRDELKTFILLLAPYAPHLAEELWERVGGTFSVHQQSWPRFEAKMLEEEEISIIVQINGKHRDTLRVKHEASKIQSEVEKLARKSAKVSHFLDGQLIKKVVFVAGKLINFVV